MTQPTCPPPAATLDGWLAVSTEGFASMNAGRPPAHLVKELVQNSLDAIAPRQPGRIDLTIAPSPSKGLTITCRDDGCGIDNLLDIRTVFWTSKTDSHLLRGRMGRGFKELLCLATAASVASGSRKLDFVMESGRRTTRTTALPVAQAVKGTIVTMHLPWPVEVSAEIEAHLIRFLPPAHVHLAVNGEVIPPRASAHRIDATLPTELYEEGKWIRPARKTVIELVPVADGEDATLYELGIPVCPLDWTPGFHADILQRVPMNPCRDAVASGYLVKVHRACLPVLLPDMKPVEILQDWVGSAATGCPAKVQQQVITQGFGANIARSVPPMGVRQFDEDARDLGVKVVDSKQTSGGFRTLLQEHVPTTRQVVDRHNHALVNAAASGGFAVGDAYVSDPDRQAEQCRRLIEAVGGKERVEAVLDFARWFCQKLLDGYEHPGAAVCSAKLALLKPVGAVATWDSNDLLTLGLDSPGLWREPLGEETLGVLIHETAHHLNAHHGRDFHKELERLAGRAAEVMLHHGGEVRQRWPGLLGA